LKKETNSFMNGPHWQQPGSLAMLAAMRRARRGWISLEEAAAPYLA
jgi:hypothetical protein